MFCSTKIHYLYCGFKFALYTLFRRHQCLFIPIPVECVSSTNPYKHFEINRRKPNQLIFIVSKKALTEVDGFAYENVASNPDYSRIGRCSSAAEIAIQF